MENFKIFSNGSGSSGRKNPQNLDSLGFPNATIKFKDTDSIFDIPDSFPDDDDDGYNSNSSSSSSKKKSKSKRTYSEAQLRGKRVVFDDVYDDFKSGNQEKLRRKEPPFVAKLTNEELTELTSYIVQKNEAKAHIQSDPYYLFVQLVAGATNTNPDFYIKSVGGKGVVGGPGRAIISPLNRGGGGTAFGGGGSPTFVHPTGTPSALPSRRESTSPSELSSVPRPGRRLIVDEDTESEEEEDEDPRDPTFGEQGQQTTSPQQQPTRINISGEQHGRLPQRGISDERLIQLLGDERWRPLVEDHISRIRQFENLPWLERIETLGIMDLSPNIYYGMNQAYQEILRNNKNFTITGTTIDDLIQDEQMRINFVGVTAGIIGISETQHPTRPSLDAREKRLLGRKSAFLRLISKFSMDRMTKEFYESTMTTRISPLQALGFYV